MTSEQSASEGSGARGVIDRVREGASSQISDQKERATDGLTKLAQAVRQSTQSLRDNQQGTVAQYVERAADRIEDFSATLRERDLRELVGDAERFARRQPAAFIGAAFAAGVLAARFLKSSADGDDSRNVGAPENRLPARVTASGRGGRTSAVGGR